MSLFKPVRVIPAPRGVGMLLAIVVPVQVATALFSVLVAVLVVPIIDFTPIIALWFALSARRWEGAPHRPLGALVIASAAMLAEWAAWWAVLATGQLDRAQGPAGEWAGAVINGTLGSYPLQLVLLIGVTAFACVTTFRRLSAARGRTSATVTPAD